MFQVQCLESATKIPTQLYSKYSIGPFIKGQSTTIGNVLRRVLLSNLPGLAITGVRITGIDHEFSTIPNVKEDVVDILLNIKQIVLKGSISEPTLVRLSTNNAGIITAANIELPSNLELVDSRQYIASFAGNGNLEMEFLIARGQNYVPSGKLDSIIPAGFLAVDAVFMPVNKVNFFVETSKNNSNSELESLILEVWTNGSITPEEAIFESSQLIINLFEQLIQNKANTSPELEELQTPTISTETHMNISIEELQLSVRAYNCLKRAQINSISDLLKYSPEKLQEIKNFGQKSADEVFDALKNKLGITLN